MSQSYDVMNFGECQESTQAFAANGCFEQKIAFAVFSKVSSIYFLQAVVPAKGRKSYSITIEGSYKN